MQGKKRKKYIYWIADIENNFNLYFLYISIFSLMSMVFMVCYGIKSKKKLLMICYVIEAKQIFIVKHEKVTL